MKPNQPAGEDGATDRAGTAYCVLGGGDLGRSVARALHDTGHAVRLVEDSPPRSEIPVTSGDPADVELLEAAGIADASTVIVATGSDPRNLLIAQLVRARFDVPRTLVLVNSPSRLDTFQEAGHEPVCATTVLSEALIESA